jgi:hypothetical protein
MTRLFNSKLLRKNAYGWDSSGAGAEKHEESKNIEDTAQPQDQHETPDNKANIITDSEAIDDFPELAGRRRQHSYRGVRE